MSTYDYSSIYDRAKELITKYGGTFQIKTLDGEKTYDPASQSNVYTSSDGTESTEPTYVYTDGLGVLTSYSDDEVDNENIKKSDKKILAIDITEPESDDVIVIGTKEYQYISHEAVQPNMEDTILYKIQVRI